MLRSAAESSMQVQSVWKLLTREEILNMLDIYDTMEKICTGSLGPSIIVDWPPLLRKSWLGVERPDDDDRNR